MAISTKKLTNWIDDNSDYLRVTEILAPLWDGGPPHMTVRIESSNWKKVKSAPVMEPTLTFVKEDEAQRVPAILSKSVRKRTNVQTKEKAGKTKAKSVEETMEEAAPLFPKRKV